MCGGGEGPKTKEALEKEEVKSDVPALIRQKKGHKGPFLVGKGKVKEEKGGKEGRRPTKRLAHEGKGEITHPIKKKRKPQRRRNFILKKRRKKPGEDPNISPEKKKISEKWFPSRVSNKKKTTSRCPACGGEGPAVLNGNS